MPVWVEAFVHVFHVVEEVTCRLISELAVEPCVECEVLVKLELRIFLGRGALNCQVGCDIGKAPSPTVAIIDSQSVKTTELANSRGFDAHKKVKGRKRHIVTDTIGIPLGVH